MSLHPLFISLEVHSYCINNTIGVCVLSRFTAALVLDYDKNESCLKLSLHLGQLMTR